MSRGTLEWRIGQTNRDKHRTFSCCDACVDVLVRKATRRTASPKISGSCVRRRQLSCGMRRGRPRQYLSSSNG